NTGWQRDLSLSYNKIGDVLVDQGNLLEALQSFRDGLAIRERLAKADPDNAGWQRDLSVSYNKIGEVLGAQGNLPEALNAFLDGFAIRDCLANVRPTTRAGSAISLCLTTRSATCWWRRAICRRRWNRSVMASPLRSGWRRQTPTTRAGNAISQSLTTRSAE